MSKEKWKPTKIYDEYVEVFKSNCEELGRIITSKELTNHIFDLPGYQWFSKNCPDVNIKTYRDFIEYLGFKNPHRKYNYEIAYEEFDKHGFYLPPQEYISCAIKMKCFCHKHPDIEQEKSLNSLIFGCFGKGAGCKICKDETQIGEMTGMWKGGISNLNVYLREFIDGWKRDSMASCNYKCVITGSDFKVIHHLYSFNKLLTETLEELNLPIHKEINNYINNEMDAIKEILTRKHYEHPLGVCLCKDVHTLYHKIYGDDNTPEQFEEFRKRYNNGEFNVKVGE